MANPFLVLGGIAIGIITAAFGVLAVPGWVASAQDASATNDISQVTIGQAASLSTTGQAKATVAAINSDAKVGVKITTDNEPTITVSADGKHYAVVVVSKSGKAFFRVDSGKIEERATAALATTDAATALTAAAG
jgi:hypothetical protein